MKYTKGELDELKNNPVAHRLASIMGVDLNELIEEEMKAIDEELDENKKLKDPFDIFENTITNNLDKLVEKGILACDEKTENGVTRKFYRSVDEPKCEEKKEYVKPQVKTQPFLMSEKQLEDFINTYTELLEARKKLGYLYGIEFNEGGSGFGFVSKIDDIIWKFVRIIFGDENTEDIADYVFGMSNFDNVKNLYDELV